MQAQTQNIFSALELFSRLMGRNTLDKVEVKNSLEFKQPKMHYGISFSLRTLLQYRQSKRRQMWILPVTITLRMKAAKRSSARNKHRTRDRLCCCMSCLLMFRLTACRRMACNIHASKWSPRSMDRSSRERVRFLLISYEVDWLHSLNEGSVFDMKNHFCRSFEKIGKKCRCQSSASHITWHFVQPDANEVDGSRTDRK